MVFDTSISVESGEEETIIYHAADKNDILTQALHVADDPTLNGYLSNILPW